jgi:hypothetical protein
MEINENKQENVNRMAITDVNSSIRLVSIWLLTCNDVITKRQKPRRLAAVFRMCWDVLLAMMQS